MEGDEQVGYVNSSIEARWSKSSIIWQTSDQTVTLLDIPHSIELAQRFQNNQRRRLISLSPLSEPYPPTEPKSRKALNALPEKAISELILERTVQLALNTAQAHIKGKWCLERFVEETNKPALEQSGFGSHTSDSVKQNNLSHRQKRRKLCYDSDDHQTGCSLITEEGHSILLPPNSTPVNGSIANHLPSFIASPVHFDLILLDPPWPNRSARRASSYSTAQDIKSLLCSLPLEDKLRDDGLIAVWVTNRASFRDLILGKDQEPGLFAQWGVELAEEWVWLKVTENGEPVTHIEGVWRKPYEVLLVGRKIGAPAGRIDSRMLNRRRRVILAVPDLHSRKPNLKEMFDSMMRSETDCQPQCLEIFARNLTAGWTSWGDQVLKFQTLLHWSKVNI